MRLHFLHVNNNNLWDLPDDLDNLDTFDPLFICYVAYLIAKLIYLGMTNLLLCFLKLERLQKLHVSNNHRDRSQPRCT